VSGRGPSMRRKSKACSSLAARDLPGVRGFTREIDVSREISPAPRDIERVVQRGLDQWRVHEMDARAVPGARASTCLICESIEVIRRLWTFPSDWRVLDDDALWELCEGPPT
jgi:hypothetical protein